MPAKRIIPCLDVRHGRVVKGVNFASLNDIGDPVELAAYYNAVGADELVFYDIAASDEDRKLFTDILERVAREVFIPLTVGGGIACEDDFKRVLDSGADKVSVNSGAIADPSIIGKAAARYGSQCVVLSLDVKRTGGGFGLFARGGRVDTGLDAIEFARLGQSEGAGEIVLNSIDTDGVRGGFDIEMLTAFASAVKVPLVASGGAGKIADFVELFERVPSVDAGLAAGIFHSGETDIRALKAELAAHGIPVRTI